MKIAIDSNVLVYAEGVDDPVRHASARQVLRRLVHQDLVIPIQALGELFTVLVRKDRQTRRQARVVVKQWADDFTPIPTTAETFSSALDLAADHDLSVWDAIILAAAAEAGCELLLSEDLHDGFTWGGVTVANPFATMRHPLLEAALDEPGREPGSSGAPGM